MLLMTLTGELASELNDATSVLLAREDAVDDADDDDMDRRSEPRRLRGKSRAPIDWKLLTCIVGDWY